MKEIMIWIKKFNLNVEVEELNHKEIIKSSSTVQHYGTFEIDELVFFGCLLDSLVLRSEHSKFGKHKHDGL